jgi:hypothetical protein
MSRFKRYDLTFSVAGHPPKPVRLALGYLPAFWSTGTLSNGLGRREFTPTRVLEYAREIARSEWPDRRDPRRGDRFHETNLACPYPFTSRLAIVDVEQSPRQLPIADVDRTVLETIDALRERLPGHRFALVGHDLGGMTHEDCPDGFDAGYVRPYWSDERVRQWIRARCARQLPLVRACGCAWAVGYFSQPSSHEREIEGLRNQIELFREIYGGAEILVWVYGAYVLQEFGVVPPAAIEDLANVVRLADGALVWGPWHESASLIERFAKI